MLRRAPRKVLFAFRRPGGAPGEAGVGGAAYRVGHLP